MAVLTVLYDACVLYPAPLRDLLMHLALTGLFRARWTEAIHEEWIRNVLEDRPDLTPAQLERTRRLMDTSVPDALVSGYEDRIPTLSLPDPDDRHVLAAAIEAGAQRIITFNLSDFPPRVTGSFGVVAQHPDLFVAGLLEASPAAICGAVRRQREYLRHPPHTAEELLATFARLRLVQTAEGLRSYLSQI